MAAKIAPNTSTSMKEMTSTDRSREVKVSEVGSSDSTRSPSVALYMPK